MGLQDSFECDFMQIGVRRKAAMHSLDEIVTVNQNPGKRGYKGISAYPTTEDVEYKDWVQKTSSRGLPEEAEKSDKE